MSLFTDLEEIPTEAGVYLIKDKDEKVIYVGKAKNLRNRVRQHFQSADYPKEEKLQELANRVEWIITRNESEALILEKKLIRQLMPKLNSMLKDDKSHLLIRITLEEEYPQLLIARETDSRNKKSIYFGPFPNNTMLRQTAKLVLRLFPICNCGKKMERFAKKGTSVRCMRERLGRCLSPYKNNVTPNEYNKTVKNVISFLKGDVADLLDNLDKEMWEASEQSNFEIAANLRDLSQAVRAILNFQEDLHSTRKNVDVIAYVEEEGNVAFCKLEIRNHRVQNIGNLLYPKEEVKLTNLGEVLAYIYGTDSNKYGLLVDESFENRFQVNLKMRLYTPRSKTDSELIKIAERNAKNEMFKFLREIQYQHDSDSILEEMQEILQLPNPPQIIHGYDISTLKGQHSVGSCVVFEDGNPNKQLYRRFRIRKSYSDPDDYAMMREVMTRRYTSDVLKTDPKPDLIIVDGGKGQLNIALEVLNKLELNIPAISIAKKNEEIFVDWLDNPIIFEQNSLILRLIQYVRDEAHRFAISYHKALRRKTVKDTIFEKIKGIGKAKVQILLHEYKKIDDIAEANITDIQKLLSINEDIAAQVVEAAKNHRKQAQF
jgi:excinuclease ABC subunit C